MAFYVLHYTYECEIHTHECENYTDRKRKPENQKPHCRAGLWDNRRYPKLFAGKSVV
jgi:hypothetical protein